MGSPHFHFSRRGHSPPAFPNRHRAPAAETGLVAARNAKTIIPRPRHPLTRPPPRRPNNDRVTRPPTVRDETGSPSKQRGEWKRLYLKAAVPFL